MSHNNNFKSTYKLPYLYDASGDISKRWSVRFSLLNPETNKYKVIKEYIPNSIKSIKDRYSLAAEIIEHLSELLISKKLTFETYHNQKESNEYDLEELINLTIDYDLPKKLRSKQSYRASAKKFLKWCISKNINNLKQIDKKVCSSYLNEHYGNQSPENFNKHRSILSSIFKDIEVRINYEIDCNYFKFISNRKTYKKDATIWKKSDLSTYFDWTIKNDFELYLLSRTVFETFIRPSELLRLKRINYYPSKGVLFIGKDNAKVDLSDFVTLSDDLTKLYNTAFEKLPDDFFLFSEGLKPGSKKLHSNRMFEQFKAVRERLNLKESATLYRLKHTGNSILSATGTDIELIQRKNRHSTKRMTENYIKVLHPRVDQDAKQFPDFNEVDF